MSLAMASETVCRTARLAQFALDRDGSLWAAARTGLAHLKGKRWEKVADEPQARVLPTACWSIVPEHCGSRPLTGCSRELPVRVVSVKSTAGATPIRRGISSRHRRTARFGLLPTASSSASIGRRIRSRVASSRFAGFPADRCCSMLKEICGSADVDACESPARAIPGADSRGSARGDRPPGEIPARGRLERRDACSLFCEDRERNIWVGTNTGLHRFSHSNVVRDAAPPCFQGAFSEAAAAFAAGDAGALWMACDDGSVTHVDEIRDGAVVSRQATPIFNVAYRDPEGTVWFGGPTALGHLENGRIMTMPLPAQVRGRPIQALVRDGSGAMWVSASRAGIFRFHDGEWSAVRQPRRSAARTMHSSQRRTAASAVVRLLEQSDCASERPSRAIVRCDAGSRGRQRSGDPRAGRGSLGRRGARFRAFRRYALRVDTQRIGGALQGSLGHRPRAQWRLLAERNEWHRAHRSAGDRAGRCAIQLIVCSSEIFDYLDGVPGTAVQMRPQPSAIETTDGRIWFSTTVGSHFDRRDASRPQHASASGHDLVTHQRCQALPQPGHRAAPARPHHQTCRSTTAPAVSPCRSVCTSATSSRVRIVSGRKWGRVAKRSTPICGPGRYTFRVTASNNDGVWNNTGASIHFTIPPAFYQTRWFYALCGLACVAVLIALYRVRMRQVAAQVRGRLEARLAERERIARELHDTLLQGMQGLIWRFQAAADRIPPGEPARQLMEAVARSRRRVARRRSGQGERSAAGGKRCRRSCPGARRGGRAVRAAASRRVSRERPGNLPGPAPDRARGGIPDRPRGAEQRVPARGRKRHRS